MVIEEHASLEILLPNEEKWRNIGENDIIQNSLSITQKCMDDSTFMLGGVYSAQMSAKVRIIGENVTSYTVTGAKILVYSWYGNDPNCKRLRGIFWATSVTKNGDIFTISASDPLIWLDSASYGEEGSSANPLYHLLGGTLGNLTNRLKKILDFVNEILDEDKKIDYYHTNDIVNHDPNNVGYCLLQPDMVGEISTKNPRDYVSWLAEIACGFVFVDYSTDVPKVRIGQFGEDIGVDMGNEISWDEVELNSCEIADFSLKFDYCVATVYTGKTEYSSVHNSGGIVIDLSDNPFKDGFWHYNWQDCHEILENIIQKLNHENVIFRPFSLKCHCAKYFELGQKIRLPDGRNSTLTSIKWLFRGGYTLGCTGKDTRIIAVSAKRSQANKIKDLCYTKINTEITQLKNNISGNSSLNITDIDNKITQLRDELDARIHNDWVMNNAKISEIDQRVHNDWIRLKINAISLKKYIGGLLGAERTVADGEFETFDGAWIFIDFTAYISGTGKITIKTFVNDIVQFAQSREFIHNCEETVHFTLPVLSSGDKKRIAVTMEGTAEITDIQAFAWGQGLNGQVLNRPESNDFVYINNNGITTVTGYIGRNVSPQIPDILGGGVTKIIEKSAFSGTDVESVYIPYGVTEIR